MATRKTWAHDLAKRAKAIGWEVTDPNGRQKGYKVICPPCDLSRCTHATSLHLTASDVNAEESATRYLDNHGLTRLETSLARAKKAVQEQLNKAQRDEADRQADALVKVAQAAKTNRAAGPYAGPEYVEDSWFIADHPAPITKQVIMTPRQAQWLFDDYNNDNRPFYRRTRDRYADVMIAGEWRLTHQGCAMDRNKVLQDGQHRLSAIAKAGVDVPMQFTCGTDPENFKALDEGLLRTGAQLLGREGEAHTRTKAALIKIIQIFDGDDRSRTRYKLTNQQLIDSFAEDKDRIKASTLAGMRYYGQAMVKSTNPNATALAAAHYLLTRANGDDNPYVAAFFHGLARERKLDRTHALDERDPRIKLRAYIGNYRSQRKNIGAFDQLCLIIIAWNHVIEGRKRDNLRWTASQSIPRITIIDAAGVCPALMEGEVEQPHLFSAVAA